MSFWTDLDDALVGEFLMAMGRDSAYTTLQVQTVNARIYADMMEWGAWHLPAIAVACHQVQYSAREHQGADNKLYTKTYKCAAYGLVGGVVNYTVTPLLDTVTEAVKEVYERMEAVLRTSRFSVNTAGVRSSGATITQGYIDVIRYPQDDTGSQRRIGVAHFQFDLLARV